MNDAVNALASQEVNTRELLPLDSSQRTVVFRSGGKTYAHTFHRLSASEWENFFAHVVAEFRQEKGGVMQIVDTDYAALVLYGKAIESVNGYHTSDGRSPRELPTWPECIPQHHRLAAIDLLMRVNLSEMADDSLIQAEGVAITVDAMWNEGEAGQMKQYRGLVHRFASPSAEHRRRFLKSKNRAFVAGGSRNGTTLIPSAHPVLVKLYDELIERTEGYSVAGRELGGKEEIVRDMDAFHKSAVVVRLFRTSMGIDEETPAT